MNEMVTCSVLSRRVLILGGHRLSRSCSLPSAVAPPTLYAAAAASAFDRCCGPLRAASSKPDTANDAVVVARDGNYGNKQVISITPRLYDYLLANVREPQILRQLREETASMRGSQMQVSPDQAQLLAMLVQILGAERCIEVGVYTVGNKGVQDLGSRETRKARGSALGMLLCTTKQEMVHALHRMKKESVELPRSSSLQNIENELVARDRFDKMQLVGLLVVSSQRSPITLFWKVQGVMDFDLLFRWGYSSVAIALVLPDSGCLVACEKDAKSLEVAKRYYDRAGVSHKVHVKHGLAAVTLKSMIQNGEVCSYDFAFIDAEKRMYQEYFELLLLLVRVGGVIVIDNVLWHGKVADPLVDDSKTVSIRNFNRILMEDKRVSISMILQPYEVKGSNSIKHIGDSNSSTCKLGGLNEDMGAGAQAENQEINGIMEGDNLDVMEEGRAQQRNCKLQVLQEDGNSIARPI
ncbi:hypothetical protein RJ640_022570 [Escallonia rubra]|uniref:Caffeoyl-CoA O-methyltransferase n=1 Tax=Escallonia rubra TaxID=112253 RepID=A0AA88R4I8_9ASTE|nr:hypothetical protein RJ640_022570 [Escallonia rubra]